VGRRRCLTSTASSTTSDLRLARSFGTTASMCPQHLCCSSPAIYPSTAFQDLDLGPGLYLAPFH
jgi:hypothetical protein